MTPEGFYSVSPEMEASLDAILGKENSEGELPRIKITFCTDPDYLMDSEALRPTYVMALAIAKRFRNVTVEEVNVELEPAAVSAYKTTSLDVIDGADMIVSYGGKYRIVNAATFWTQNSFSYNGEYRMISILASLTAIEHPVAYFVTGHGETYYDPEAPESDMSLSMSALADLLTERGMEIRTLDIAAVERVPEDCALLIINCPTSDFVTDPDQYDRFDYVSDLEKLDRYLVSESGAVIFNKAQGVKLPNLDSFLYEWGIAFGEGVVKDEENCLEDVGEPGSAVLGVYDTDENGIGGAYYGDFAALSSSPKMVFTDSGYLYCAYGDSDAVNEPGTYNGQRVYSHFIGSSDGALAYESLGSSVLTAEEGRKTLAAITTRTYLDNYTSENSFSYLFATNSEDFFSSEVLGNLSYANYSIMSTVITNISRTDRYASIELGGTSLNSPKYGGKQTVSTTLAATDTKVYSSDAKEVVKINKGVGSGIRTAVTVVASAVPVAVLTVGVCVFVRRKFL